MYLVGKAQTDSEYGDFCGLTDIRIFLSLDGAIRFIQENVEITHYHRDNTQIRNPLWHRWYLQRPGGNGFGGYPTYEAWKADEEPYEIPNPNPQPYDDYYIVNDYVVLAVDPLDGSVPITTENDKLNNSLFTFDNFTLTVRQRFVEDDLI